MMPNKIACQYTNEIVCPWCGCEFSDSWEMGNGGEDTELEECPNCEKEFYATRNISVSYCSEKAEYGTCSGCGKENVVIESGRSTDNSYSDLCQECACKSEKRAREEYFKMIMKNGLEVI